MTGIDGMPLTTKQATSSGSMPSICLLTDPARSWTIAKLGLMSYIPRLDDPPIDFEPLVRPQGTLSSTNHFFVRTNPRSSPSNMSILHLHLISLMTMRSTKSTPSKTPGFSGDNCNTSSTGRGTMFWKTPGNRPLISRMPPTLSGNTTWITQTVLDPGGTPNRAVVIP